MKYQPKQNTSNIGKGLELSIKIHTFFGNVHKYDDVEPFILSLIQSTKEETRNDTITEIASGLIKIVNTDGTFDSEEVGQLLDDKLIDSKTLLVNKANEENK